MHTIDDFNLELCQLKLYILLSQSHDNSSDTDTTNEHGIEVLVDEAALSFRSSPGIWARLISIIPRGYAEMVGYIDKSVMAMLIVFEFRNRCILRLSEAVQAWSSGPRAKQQMPDESSTCEGLLASIDVAESKIPNDASSGIILEIMKMIVSVRTALQLAKAPTDPVLDEGLDGSREAQHEQRLCHTCMWYESQGN